jgi:hypothetical protein
VHTAWLPLCPACQTPAQVKWGIPARLALPSG